MSYTQTEPVKPVLISDWEKWMKSNLLLKAEDLKFKTSYEDDETCDRSANITIGNNKVIGAFIREIPPGKHTSFTHRHNMEALIYIIQGRGYDIIEGKRYDWKAGDTVTEPPWAWHQHFCTSKEPVRFFAVTTIPFLSSLGLLVFGERSERKPKI